ncbi:hypothetical protein VNO77_27587 [Canavalia gladiata]|uniref:Uncharacterized protein n=1 Tax=Canavalia gladiata TaxID=3824 RepID=A0AAN9KZ45_CANGL
MIVVSPTGHLWFFLEYSVVIYWQPCLCMDDGLVVVAVVIENYIVPRHGRASLGCRISIPTSKKSIASGGTNRPSHDRNTETGDEYPVACYLQQSIFSLGLGWHKPFHKGRTSLLTTPRDHIMKE